MPADLMPDLTGVLLGGTFRVQGRISEGGMGTVYHAVDEKLDRPVALKVMKPDMAEDPEFSERFTREAKAMASVLHPGLPVVYAFGEDQGLAYMALELLDGETLHELIQTKGTLQPRRACGIAVQILDALGAAHERGIIHRDVKPGNIMIARRGGSDRVKLLDFGLVKMKKGKHSTALTDPAVLLGTPHYMAPELITGEAFDHRCDLYAVGILLYEMLVGKPPFIASKIHEILRMHVREEPLPLRSFSAAIPEGLEAIVARALAKKPEDRYWTARDLADALERQIETLPQTLSDTCPIAQPRPAATTSAPTKVHRLAEGS